MPEPIGSGKIREGIKDFLKAVWTGVGPDKKARHVAKQYVECEFMSFAFPSIFPLTNDHLIVSRLVVRVAQELYVQDVAPERWASYPPLDPDWVNEKFKHFINNHRKGNIPGDGEGSPADDYDLASLKEFCGTLGLNYERVALVPAQKSTSKKKVFASFIN
jgi:hypothetical protein